jgi:DHA1 family bicyclomycin/chloramphenicol resistance-like MFS transporter
VVPLVAALAMLGPFSIDAIFPAFPAIGEEFGAAPFALQQLIGLYLASYALMALFHGPLSDAAGRRRVILAGTLLYAASALVCALAESFQALLLGRLLMGAVAGAGIIVGRAVLRDLFAGARAERAMAAVSLLFGMAPALAPVVGAAVLDRGGWRAIFGCLAGFGLLIYLAALRWLPETHPPSSRTPLRLSALTRGYRAVLRDRCALALALATSFNFAALFLYIASAPALVFERLGLGPSGFALLFVPIVAGMMAGAAGAASLAGRLARGRTVAFAYGAIAFAQAANLLVAAGGLATWPWPILPLVPLSAGIAAAFPLITVSLLDRFPTARGLASSLQTALGLGLLSLVAGLLAPLVFHDLAALAAASALLSLTGYAAWRAGAGG